MPKFNWLRSFGPVGTFAANALVFLTMNWALALSVFVGLATAISAWMRSIALNPITYAAVGAFLAVLWTTVGICALVDRRKPQKVQVHHDYRYGLTFEGFPPIYYQPSAGIPVAGALTFQLQLRNFSPGPIKYEIETFDITIGTRIATRPKKGELHGFMARGAARTSRLKAFEQKEVKEFYGQGDVIGKAEVSVAYGPPDGLPIRRWKIVLDLHITLSEDGESLGYADNIISEVDEEI
jgi:hypothetical protein